MTEIEVSPEWLALVAPKPGERCQLCHRRVNRKRTDESPESVTVSFNLPADRAAALKEWVETLQEYVGADGHAYSKGAIYEASVLKGIQQREELKSYFDGG